MKTLVGKTGSLGPHDAGITKPAIAAMEAMTQAASNEKEAGEKALPRIGVLWGKSHLIGDEETIMAFAKSIHTYNRLHLDPDVARQKGLPGILVPGVLIGGLVDETMTEDLPDVAVRDLRLKFRKFVHPGDSLFITCKVTEHKLKNTAKIEVRIESGSELVGRGTCSLMLL